MRIGCKVHPNKKKEKDIVSWLVHSSLEFRYTVLFVLEIPFVLLGVLRFYIALHLYFLKTHFH